MSDSNNIFKELKKRKVFRSITIYAAFAFVLIQVCSIVFPALYLPDWTTTFVVVLIIIGFPTTLILSWIYDVTPGGVKKTDSVKLSSNINYSTIMLILVIVGGLLFYFQDSFFKPKVNPKSIAVLPFDNYSPKLEYEFLSDGFTEVIIANLAKVKDLIVISRTSIMRYKDTDMSLKEIAEELNVANILEGSIQKKGNKIRVVGQLIEAKTDEHLWAETYDEEFEDIFSIQTSIAKEIAFALKSKITESEKSVIEEKITDNIEAYEMYLKVKELRTRSQIEDNKIRKELLKKIITIDPEFAEAHALLSIEYSESVHFGFNTSQKRKEKAKHFIEKAFSLKPESPDVRFAYGYYYYGCFKDYLRALEHYQFALSKEPGNGEYNEYIGYVHRRLGNWDETLKYLEKAVVLDPNDLSVLGNLIGTYGFLKQYDKLNFIDIDKKYYRISPEEGSLYAFRSKFTFWLEGNTMNARKIIKQSTELTPNFDYYDNCLFGLDVYDENYATVLEHVSTVKDSIIFTYEYILPKYASIGFAYWLMDKREKQVQASKKALNILRNLKDYEGDPRYHSMLGFIFALLDQKEDAVREAKMAVALSPPHEDAFKSGIFEGFLCEVYAIIGEHVKALNMIEIFLSEPSNFNWYNIKYHMIYNKLYKNNPRFISIIKKDEDRFRRESTYDLSIYMP